MESTTFRGGHDGAPLMGRDLVPQPPLLDGCYGLSSVIGEGGIGAPKGAHLSERIHAEQHGLLVPNLSRRLVVEVELPARDNWSVGGRSKKPQPETAFNAHVGKRLKHLREDWVAQHAKPKPKMEEFAYLTGASTWGQYQQWERRGNIPIFYLANLCLKLDLDPWQILKGVPWASRPPQPETPSPRKLPTTLDKARQGKAQAGLKLPSTIRKSTDAK